MFLLFHTIHVIIFLSIDKPFLLFRNTLKKKTFAPSPTGGNNSKQKERAVGTPHCFYYSILYTSSSSFEFGNYSNSF